MAVGQNVNRSTAEENRRDSRGVYLRMRAKGDAEPDASELMTVVEPTRNINLYQLIEIVPLVYTTKTQIIKLSEHHW